MEVSNIAYLSFTGELSRIDMQKSAGIFTGIGRTGRGVTSRISGAARNVANSISGAILGTPSKGLEGIGSQMSAAARANTPPVIIRPGAAKNIPTGKAKYKPLGGDDTFTLIGGSPYPLLDAPIKANVGLGARAKDWYKGLTGGQRAGLHVAGGAGVAGGAMLGYGALTGRQDSKQ